MDTLDLALEINRLRAKIRDRGDKASKMDVFVCVNSEGETVLDMSSFVETLREEAGE